MDNLFFNLSNFYFCFDFQRYGDCWTVESREPQRRKVDVRNRHEGSWVQAEKRSLAEEGWICGKKNSRPEADQVRQW